MVGFFDPHCIQFENFRILRFRINFARWIGLRVEQLPLFATLKGNDLVLVEELTDFHNKLIGKHFAHCIRPLIKTV